MSRSTWKAVLVTATVLVVAGTVSRVPWRTLGTAVAPLAPRALAALRPAVDAAGQALAALGRAASTPSAIAAEGHVALAGAIALLVALCVLAGSRSRRRSRGAILRLARAGRAHARIARRTGLARDAVRLALSPALRRRCAAPARSAGRQVSPLPGKAAGGAGRALNATR